MQIRVKDKIVFVGDSGRHKIEFDSKERAEKFAMKLLKQTGDIPF
mgnify:CR=1 FL=1